MARAEDIGVWARREVANLAAEEWVHEAVLTRLEPIPGRAAWYRWLLEIEIDAADEPLNARPLMRLLGELRQLRLRPVVLVVPEPGRTSADS